MNSLLQWDCQVLPWIALKGEIKFAVDSRWIHQHDNPFKRNLISRTMISFFSMQFACISLVNLQCSASQTLFIFWVCVLADETCLAQNVENQQISFADNPPFSYEWHLQAENHPPKDEDSVGEVPPVAEKLPAGQPSLKTKSVFPSHCWHFLQSFLQWKPRVDCPPHFCLCGSRQQFFLRWTSQNKPFSIIFDNLRGDICGKNELLGLLWWEWFSPHLPPCDINLHRLQNRVGVLWFRDGCFDVHLNGALQVILYQILKKFGRIVAKDGWKGTTASLNEKKCGLWTILPDNWTSDLTNAREDQEVQKWQLWMKSTQTTRNAIKIIKQPCVLVNIHKSHLFRFCICSVPARATE